MNKSNIILQIRVNETPFNGVHYFWQSVRQSPVVQWWSTILLTGSNPSTSLTSTTQPRGTPRRPSAKRLSCPAGCAISAIVL
ncbi:hypothetical protein K0M31_007171 [Melipona bicolor]|uniref:Uncharacterized protein n=1 Tax=Melipona bicolor TaxID=60889 RepID=A0AA40FSF1_9HYME|nr:hypothetical protein K0M31_007171 [Melipona bicolor]